MLDDYIQYLNGVVFCEGPLGPPSQAPTVPLAFGCCCSLGGGPQCRMGSDGVMIIIGRFPQIEPLNHPCLGLIILKPFILSTNQYFPLFGAPSI